MQKLRILAESEHWVVIDKPAGFHTHPPEDKTLKLNPRWNALAVLERQLGQKLFPVHRLDRAASGALLYSRQRDLNHPLQEQFAEGKVAKRYFVVARGKAIGPCRFDSPLRSESGADAPALTVAEPCFSFALPLPHPRGGDRVFTALEVVPSTGRFHQIRRHFAQAGLPLVGDSRHGDRRLNREFAELTGCRRLFLRCMSLEFRCPVAGKAITVRARWGREWLRLFDLAGACAFTASPSPRRRSPS